MVNASQIPLDTLFDQLSSSCKVPGSERHLCMTNTNFEECTARGCCWKPDAINASCFLPQIGKDATQGLYANTLAQTVSRLNELQPGLGQQWMRDSSPLVADWCPVTPRDSSCTPDNSPYGSPFEARRGQTPKKDSPLYRKEWQDFHMLQGHVSIHYERQNNEIVKAKARVHVVAKMARIVAFWWLDNVPQSLIDNTAVHEWSSILHTHPGWQSFKESERIFEKRKHFGESVVVVQGVDSTGESYYLSLQPIHFVWLAPPLKLNQDDEFSFTDQKHASHSSDYRIQGNKGAIVELFGWPHDAVAQECAFISKAGYLGVRVWPPNAHIMNDQTTMGDHKEHNPWWVVYQPTSYNLDSRMGNATSLKRMIRTCRAVGVRVYIDAVVNHMAAKGNDIYEKHHWRNMENGPGLDDHCISWGPTNSTDGTPFFTFEGAVQFSNVTGMPRALEFPAVPFGPTDFHCDRGIEDWSNGDQVTNGWLLSLPDLDTSKENVRIRIADYFVHLLSLGISGMRIDSAKHISPRDMTEILDIVRQKMGNQLPQDFLLYLEVILSGNVEHNVYACDNSSEYNYFGYFEQLLQEKQWSSSEIDSVKLWMSDYPWSFPMKCNNTLTWPISPTRMAIQNDDHDQQDIDNPTRYMGHRGSVLLHHQDIELHQFYMKRLFSVYPDIPIRLVLSSYTFNETSGALGFPDGKSDCTGINGECNPMMYTPAYVADSCGYSCVDENGQWLEGKYTRVHRSLLVVNSMRKWIGLNEISAEELGIGHCTV